MTVLSIRVTAKEERAIKEFSKFTGKSVSELLKESFFERLENEYDLKLIEEFESKVEKNKIEFVDFEEFEKNIGL